MGEVLDRKGGFTTRGVNFEYPSVREYPSNKEAQSFVLSGQDSRVIQVTWMPRPGVLQARELVHVTVFADRFRAQEIPIGPVEVEIDPTYA
jgi:hypothetical protein